MKKLEEYTQTDHVAGTASPEGGRLRGWIQYSSMLEGGLAVAMLLGTYALLGLPPSGPLLVLAFCGTLLVYHADRALGLAPEDRFNRPDRLAWLRSHQWYVRLSAALALAASVAALLSIRPATLAAGAVLALLASGYVAPLLPHGRRLKAFRFVEPIAIAAAWAVGGVVVPAIEAAAPLTGSVLALTGYRFLFVFANVLLTDVPDRAGDRRAGLRTAATEYAPKRLRTLAVAALGIALAGGFAALAVLGGPWLLAVDLAGPLLLLGLALRWPARPRWPYAFLADLMLAWPAVTALAGWVAA